MPKSLVLGFWHHFIKEIFKYISLIFNFFNSGQIHYIKFLHLIHIYHFYLFTYSGFSGQQHPNLSHNFLILSNKSSTATGVKSYAFIHIIYHSIFHHEIFKNLRYILKYIHFKNIFF